MAAAFSTIRHFCFFNSSRLSQTTKTQPMTRAIADIAWEIRRTWKNPYFGAVPYLRAMCDLSSLHDYYGADSAREIVLYFLSNANTFRGPKAKALKEELKAILAEDTKTNINQKEN